jgi:hypothetical protein
MNKTSQNAAHARGDRDRVALRRLAEEAGCVVLHDGTMEIDGVHWPFVSLDCTDNARAIRLLNLLAARDALHMHVAYIAKKLYEFTPRRRDRHGRILPRTTRDVAGQLHHFVKQTAFVREKRETFQHALLTINRGKGDCDDHARLFAALCHALRIPVEIVGVANAQGKIGHVAARFLDGNTWVWAETTIDAELGEEPRAAAKRLRVRRPDIWADRRLPNVREIGAASDACPLRRCGRGRACHCTRGASCD